MRPTSLLLTALVFLGAAKGARAAEMDPTPERLTLQPSFLSGGDTCQSVAANPGAATGKYPGLLPSAFACRPDNVAFRNLMSELGYAIAPTAFHPARTTGFGGFALTVEATYTKINQDAVSTAANGASRAYWKDGTEGALDPASRRYASSNASPDSLLQIYSLKARKGFPLGLEVAGSLGTLANTSLWLGGADIRWAVLEGFRKGALGYVPDVSIGSGVRTLAGSSKFFLTTVGIDATISKPFTLADMAVLTPYVGYQRLFILADSTVLDATPNTDALKQCGYAGLDPKTGAPVCRNRLPNGAENNGDFNNHVTFEKVRVHRHRGILGVNYRYEMMYLAGQWMMDLTSPSEENPGLVGGRQWTTALEAGVSF